MLFFLTIIFSSFFSTCYTCKRKIFKSATALPHCRVVGVKKIASLQSCWNLDQHIIR